MPKLKPISKQVIVITGASSGIGLATAKMAAKKGARLVISSRNEEELQSIAEELQSFGASRVVPVKADVSSYDDMETLRDHAISKFGRIDTWINNAGTSIYGPLLEIPLEDEKKLFDINFWGIRHGCHVAVQALKQSGGVIINLGSEVSGRSIPVQGMYSATKHAVKAYTDALRMELEKEGLPISVCLIRPTAINTPFPEHATSFLKKGEPSLPSPTYHPDVVATAILKCAEAPQRDVFVGGGSRLFDILDTFFPRMVDRMMEGMMFSEQSKGSNVPHTEAQEGLRHAPAHEGKDVGDAKGRMRTTSAYTALATSPWRMLAVAGVLFAVGSVLFASKVEAPEREDLAA